MASEIVEFSSWRCGLAHLCGFLRCLHWAVLRLV